MKRDHRMAWARRSGTDGKPFMLALSQLLSHKLSSALMLLSDLLGDHFHSPGRSNCGCVSLVGWRFIFPLMYIHTWGPAWRGFGTSKGTGSENRCHSWKFAMDVTHSFGESQNQASVPFKSPSDVKFCRSILWNGHAESIFNSKYPHFGAVAFSSISFHHSKTLIKNLFLQWSRLIQFRFYLLKNNHLSATEKEEKNLSLKIWRSASL